MPGSVVELSPAVGIRRSRGLADINPDFVSKSGLGTSFKVETSRGSLRIQHRPSSSPGVAADGRSRFPKLNECAHFHYEVVDLGPVTLQLHEDGLRAWSTAEEGSSEAKIGSNYVWAVQVSSRGKSWVVRRTLDNFRLLDDKLHRCIYDRKFSNLLDLSTNNLDSDLDAIRPVLNEYLARLTHLAGNLINCGPVLNWLELDNRGHRLIALEDADINTPAVAAAYAIRRYVAQASDEISFEVGDMISVIDMPPPEESVWWRGKRGFDVGFFPSDCVRLIGDKVPKGVSLVPPTSSSPVLSHSAPSSLPPFNSGGGASSMLASAAATTAASAATEGGVELKRRSSSSLQLPAKPVLRKHGKLISFFRSFILSRPSRRKLKQSGILKERVFGCDLGEHLLNSVRDVPLVLKCCAEFIETYGVVDGIYRLSGITSNIQKLRNAFDEDRIPALNEDEAIRQDIHAVSSLLKMYFRELPNPLCTYQLYDQFVTAVQGPEEIRLAKMRQVVQQLPPPHYRTLEYLMRHLSLVAAESESTGMTAKNVAIVWAPNLLRCKELEVGGVAALQGVGVQAVVTEYLVRFVDLIFSDKIPTEVHTLSIDTPKRNRPKSLAISTPTKLLSLEEARLRALQAAERNDSSYIEVGGGPASLPTKYHTVIDLPDRKRSLKNKKSPSGWKSFFAKGRSSTQAKAQRKASSASAGSTGHVSRKDSSLASPGRATVTYTRQRLRPVKSAESLVSASTPSNRNSVTVESPVMVISPLAVPLVPPIRLLTPPASPSTSDPASRCHNRSVSHDSYFRVLNMALVGRELRLEEEGSDLSKDSLHLLEDNQQSWLSYASNGSDVRCNMTLDDSDLKVMSSREMLVDTEHLQSAQKASSDESAVDGSHPDDRQDGIGNPTYDLLPSMTTTANLQQVQAEVYHNHVALASPSPSPDDTEAQIPDLPLEDSSPVSNSPVLTHPAGGHVYRVSSHSSFSYAGATVSENESFTLHSPVETLESCQSRGYSLLDEIDAEAAASVYESHTAGTQALLSYENLHLAPSTSNDLYGNLSYDGEIEENCYENVVEPHKVEIGLGSDDLLAYENVEGRHLGDLNHAPLQSYENLEIQNETYENVEFPAGDHVVEEDSLEETNYENVVIPREVNVYEDVIPPPPLVEPNTVEVSEMQYQQVKVLRRSIQEVNNLFFSSQDEDVEQVILPPSLEFDLSSVREPHHCRLPSPAAESVGRVPLSLSLPSLEASDRAAKANFSLPLTPTSPPKSEPPVFATEGTSKRKIESEIGRDLLHAWKMRSELERVRQTEEKLVARPTTLTTPPALPAKKRNSVPTPTKAWTPGDLPGSSPVKPSTPSTNAKVSPTNQDKEGKKEGKPLWRPGHERKASVKELLSKFETDTSPEDQSQGKKLGRTSSNGDLKGKGTGQDHKSDSENHSFQETKLNVSKDWLSRTKSLDRMVLTNLDPRTVHTELGFNLTNIDKTSTGTERIGNYEDITSQIIPNGSKTSLTDADRESVPMENVGESSAENVDPKTALLAASVDINDPCARLRIERYKAERRSFLREKFKPESFRGEKDEVLQRLKQKASSPTSDRETANCNVVPVHSIAAETVPSPNPQQPVDEVTHSAEKLKDPDVIDEDVNVRERAALFARSQPVHSHPSAKRKKEDANLSSSEEASDRRILAFSSPLKSASMSSINNAKSPRRIRDMAAMFEVSKSSSGNP